MNKFLEALKEIDNYTYTENGAVAYRSTGNKVLDAFGSLAAMKDSDAVEILNTFYNAFYADKELAMRLLFYVRDVRGGQGMRRIFRIIVRSLANTNPELVINNLDNFLFFGRGDDILCLFDTEIGNVVMDYAFDVLSDDMETLDTNRPCTLLAKWMPSINTSSEDTRRLANQFIKYIGISAKQYRKMLSALREKIGIIETYMSSNDWEKINFQSVPSRASMIYTDAFLKHCKDEYIDYLKKVAAGDAKINAGALFPVDIVHRVITNTGWDGGYKMKDQFLCDALWDALPNYLGDTEEIGLCVVDTSGSMYGTPLEVAVSLGLYCADKAKGPFKNHFITFSANPKLQESNGNNIFEKVFSLNRADWEMNTNVEAVFDLILQTAIENNLKQDELPTKLYIISDMQFDECAVDNSSVSNMRSRWERKPKVNNETLFSTIAKRFADNGYTMPGLVFWNVRASQCGMFQMKGTDENCCMVSGYSPSLFKSVIDGTELVEEITEEGETVVKQKLDPVVIMTNTLMNERYNRVFVG